MAITRIITPAVTDANVTLAKLSATGTKNSTTFLRGDNTFNAPPLGGITMADQWRLTADMNIDNGSIFNSNLERIDTSGQGTIGTAMSESSGVFSFPSTGIYWVHANINYKKNAARRYVGVNIRVTTNNSSYAELTESYSEINPPDSNDAYSNVTTTSYIDVTDTSNVKVRFNGLAPATISAIGNTARNLTTFTFIRLGDT